MSAVRHPDLAWTAFVLALLLAAYWTTFRSMADIWGRSQTFAHGYLIFPVSVWMVWRQRTELANLPRAPSLLGLCALAAAGAGWLLAAAASVQVAQQFSLVLMIASGIAALLGWRLTQGIAFPLAYLLLAVPCGEVLIPPLMEYTASFVTAALRIAGIPVFRDSNNFSLPSGNWSVVEACSGLRYLIASLALGLLFAYLNFRSWRKRLAFIALAALLPIVANGVRAFLIVLLGHYSEMRFATGVDHLLYGWLFFGVVMLLLFWLGRQWRDPSDVAATPAPQTALPLRQANGRIILASLGAIGLLLAYQMAAAPLDTQQPSDACPTQVQRRKTPDIDEWRPLHKGCHANREMRMTVNTRPVTIFLTSYRHQGKDADLLTTVTREREAGKPLWRELPATIRTASVDGRRFTVQEFQLTSEAGKRLVWLWYRQSGIVTSSPALAKLLLARSKLTGGDDSGKEYALVTPYEDDYQQAILTLQTALERALPAIEQEPADAAA